MTLSTIEFEKINEMKRTSACLKVTLRENILKNDIF